MFKKFLSSKVLLSCLALSLLAGACGSDDGGTVQEIGASSGSGSCLLYTSPSPRD